MARSGDLHFHRFPQSKSVDAVRWLSPLSAFDRFVAAAVHDTDAASSSLEIHSLTVDAADPNSPLFDLRSSWSSPSRISSLRSSQTPHKHLVAAASTLAGSLHLLFVDPVDGSIDSELSIADDRSLHAGPISAVDLQAGGQACVSVGEDGRVNLVTVGESRLDHQRVHDSRGLVSYMAARWASPAEFATGGLGFGVQWWDQRKPGGLVSQFKGNWARGSLTGIVHSIDIHPSRKHICVVGGSSGTVFAWDLRLQQQPILLSGVSLNETTQPISESDVWEVQYDSYTHSSNINSAPSTRILPIMMCSEDGILAVLEQGEEPIELLAENCAINAFDIDPQNPSDVICGLEWESIGILTRSRETMVRY
ncbi:nuclear pore complex protein NUP43 [Elaeis guineensis]|uniref:Nuclear pore complex protein NUP43 n=1 Tax=Elaeis guineensis var. tenera TaxID=51953 RepID=A0A6I9QEU8_ELAGV|nr:nuclear pore complex protein NUP43 [Elaeis guineensis]